MKYGMRAIGLCWCLFGLIACGGTVKKSFTNPAYPLSKVSSIAILPFDGVSEAGAASDLLSMVIANKEVFDYVVDRTQIQAVLAEHNLDATLLDEKTLLQKGNFINADALLKGRVTRFVEGAPHYPLATATEISMSLKLVSTETGQIIWTQLYSEKSGTRGLLAPSVDELFLEMAEEIANDLVKERQSSGGGSMP